VSHRDHTHYDTVLFSGGMLSTFRRNIMRLSSELISALWHAVVV
jgi:hypothetical protein